MNLAKFDDKITIKQGRNVWLLARTGRDGADRDSVVHSAGLIMAEWLRAPSPTGLRGIFQVTHSSAQGAVFNVGGARPLKVFAERGKLELPVGQELGHREASPIVRQVCGAEAWSVLVDFDWVGAELRIIWPFHQAAVLGATSLNDLQLDWLLIGAVQPLVQLARVGVAS